MSEIEGGNVRGQPPVKWRDRVQEYVRERGEGSLRNLEQARRECQDRERWKLFCCGHPLVGDPRGRHRNELHEIIHDINTKQTFLEPISCYINVLLYLGKCWKIKLNQVSHWP